MNISFFANYRQGGLSVAGKGIHALRCGIACTLNRTCKSPKMSPTGEGKKSILVIAEAPGEREDQRGVQLIGPAGQVLRRALGKLGVDLDRDCRKTNAVRCRPPGNVKPTGKELAACRAHIDEEITQYPPKLILLLGQAAVDSFLSPHWKKDIGTIGRWRGWVIPDQRYGCWVCPTFHPSYVLREQGNAAVENVFVGDLANALNRFTEPIIHHAPDVAVTDGLEPLLPAIAEAERVVFDFETTRLKPYQSGSRIVTCGACVGHRAIAFPVNDWSAKPLKQVLRSPNIRKIAHNMKFEHQWAAMCLGVETRGWYWDTMQAAHILDNRSHITGLKFQTYANFGVADYSSSVEHLLNGNEDGLNSLAHGPPPETLLRYNALDAYWTMRLAELQWGLFK